MAEVFRYGPHHGEEPPISGTRGSGTIFLSRCTLKCVYCQNYPWSQDGKGHTYPDEALADVFRELAGAGCHNWNLVSPTPWLPMILAALKIAKNSGISLPVVYNTSGFERVETLRRLDDVVDVYLPDLRYARRSSAEDGSGAADYVSTARAAIMEMWRQTGPFQVDADGTAVRGTICRLLILPNRAGEAVENLEWLARNVGTGIPVSVMAQYIPAYRAAGTEGWNRPITRQEYETVAEAVERLGFAGGWMQSFRGNTPDELVGYRMQSGGAAAGLEQDETE